MEKKETRQEQETEEPFPLHLTPVQDVALGASFKTHPNSLQKYPAKNAQKSSSPVREAERGFCGTVGRPARLGFADCGGGLGLVVLEEPLAFAAASAFGSAFAFFSDDAETESPLLEANRLSGRVCWSLGTKINRNVNSGAGTQSPHVEHTFTHSHIHSHSWVAIAK